MSVTTGEPGGFPQDDEAVPDVTQVPLRQLIRRDDGVLDAAIQRLVDDVVDGGEITAGFANAP